MNKTVKPYAKSATYRFVLCLHSHDVGSRLATQTGRHNMKTIVSRLGTLGFGLTLALIANSSPAEASSITIQNVTVTQAVGTDTRTWCMINCLPNFSAGNLWAAFANAVINSPSTGGNQVLVLTQNPTA